MSVSRIKNTKRIFSSSIISLLINSILPFVNRTIIIRLLGAEFTGLSGLFSSILQVLSLADFGLNMVIVYYLYEPLAKNDTGQISKIMSWIRRIYYIIGGIITGAGLIISPFLTHFIHGRYPENINLYVLYLIFLTNSGISYFLSAYKQVLLTADQKKDIINNINSVVKVFVNILQFMTLLLLRNYYIYAILMIFGTMMSNIILDMTVKKRYPYLKKSVEKTKLDNSVKKEIVGLVINRFSNVSRNSFDSLIISSSLGLIATSIYGNYYMIFSIAMSITAIFSGSIQASVGNSIAVKSERENYENLLDFSFLYSWITGWCTVTMVCLYQPFMKLWVGESLMLSNKDMILFSAYFYFINMNHMRNQYILGNAFWWRLKWAYLVEAVGNFVLNIILGKLFGITGVLIATIVTIFFCNYLMCNSVLFKTYFKEQSISKFYKQQFYYLLITAIITILVYMICQRYESIFIRAIICVIIPNTLFVIFYYPCSRRKSSLRLVRNFIKVR